MGKGFLIDSNVLIEYIGDLLPEKAYSFVSNVIDEQFNISVINKIEVLGHNTAGKDVEDFIGLADVIELNEDIISKTIELRKNYKTKLPDAIISATALLNELTVITRNTQDFNKIDGLKVLNPIDL
jgi:predicted nucleic acid-binding protein